MVLKLDHVYLQNHEVVVLIPYLGFYFQNSNRNFNKPSFKSLEQQLRHYILMF